jgi:catechol 2,3-dioxygenase-like lactoylglutathione lyase family enzyme
MRPEGILETCLYVDDLGAAEHFYATVLGLEFVSRQEGRHVFFRCGSQMLLLFNASRCRLSASEVPAHGAQGPSHVAFSVNGRGYDAWREQLEQHGVAVERHVEWPQGGWSLYFRDPAGNSLELATPEIWEGDLPTE